MIALGVVLAVIGALVDRLSVLITIGLVLIVVGALLLLLGHPAY